jgi:hypothetical protein
MPTKEVWNCLHCFAKFDTYQHFKQHESVCDINKCNRCDHDTMLMAHTLDNRDRINNGKRCSFKKRDDK